jgi:integrase
MNHSWDSAIRRTGLRYRNPYQSRHTFACWSLAAGANPNFVAAQMGHSTPPMVYEVYGAWMKENDEAQIDMLNKSFNVHAPSMPQRKKRA